MNLLIGGDSEIGAATYRFLQAQGRPVAATTRRRERVADGRPFLDFAAPLGDWEPPQGTRAVCIFAAVARLAACAADPAGSALINLTQTLALAGRLIAHGIHVVFLSTNQVFDGNTPNVAADAPACPVSEYGRQKAQTEAVLREHISRGAPVAILRLAKVVSPHMPLIEGWLADLEQGKAINAFEDMTLAPAPAAMVSAAISTLMEERATGIYQLTGPRDVTYAEVGRFLAAHLDADAGLVVPTSAREVGLPVGATPRYTTLDSSRLRDRYGFQVPDAWEVIESLIASRADAGVPQSASGARQ